MGIVAYVSDNNLPGISLRSYAPRSFLDTSNPEVLAPLVVKMLEDGHFRQEIADEQQRILEEIYYSNVVARSYVEEFESLVDA